MEMFYKSSKVLELKIFKLPGPLKTSCGAGNRAECGNTCQAPLPPATHPINPSPPESSSLLRERHFPCMADNPKNVSKNLIEGKLCFKRFNFTINCYSGQVSKPHHAYFSQL